MSLHVLADHMASKGRNGDSMLVHMTPGEVAGLHALAVKHGGQLTINPDTGLPEANFLKSLLPMLAGAALNFFVPGLGAAVGGAFGLGAAAGTGIAVGGLTSLATGSLSRGLMAGLGAYGGAGLAESLAGAGTSANLNEALAGSTSGAAPQIVGDTLPAAQGTSGQAFNEYLKSNANPATMSGSEAFSAGVNAAADAPGTFLKDNLKYIGAAAAPIMADAMVPTTTKMPTAATTPAYIRQKLYDPYTQTYKSLAPVEASKWGTRSFSDAYTNPQTGVASLEQRQPTTMAGGGIVALAGGGVSDADILGWFNANPGANDALIAQTMQQANVTPEQVARATGSNYADVNARYLAATAPTTQASTLPLVTTQTQEQTAASTATSTPAYTQYSAGDIEDYIRANKLDTAGITAATQQFNADPTAVKNAQDTAAMVNNIYRNVLGRDADPTGLAFWTNEVTSGKRTGQEMYQDFLKSAKSNTELGKFDMTLDQAMTPYKGYMSADTGNIVDEWIRNTLGREVTDADRQQKWYKDATDKGVMTTYDKAKDIYSNFQNYAVKDATATAAKQIADAKALLASKGLTEIDVLKQTGKTIAELVGSGMNLDADLMKASQLLAPGKKAGFDFSTITKPTITNTFGGDTVARTVTNPYGNETNPGDLTYNRDGTITVTPNIPYRPYGGFSGMGEVKDAYTRGGGSLGYVSPVVKTAAEHEARYNKLTGDSQAAYEYLMGRGANPVQSVAANSTTGLMRPYWTGGARYTPKFLKTNADGSVSSSTTNPNAPTSGATPTAKSINVTLADGTVIPAALGSDGYYYTPDGAKFDVSGKKVVPTVTENFADGGMAGYSVGGGLGSLGSYSDGGRLLKGPGDGVSDSIPATIGAKQQPARLADGEFVVPARIVSELGNGSTDAGAKKLYAMMDRVQRARGKTTGKNKVAANTRADKYLPA